MEEEIFVKNHQIYSSGMLLIKFYEHKYQQELFQFVLMREAVYERKVLIDFRLLKPKIK